MQEIEYYLFGAGSGGQMLYSYFKENKPEIKVKGFIDNFTTLQQFDQKPIYKLDQINLSDNEQILITSNFGEEIANQLTVERYIRGKDFINIGNLPRMLEQYTRTKRVLTELNERNIPVNFLGLNDLQVKKKSDTLFILGSGPTINEISGESWQEIKEHDSWGFNHFALHDFKPNFYSTEFAPSESNRNIELVRNMFKIFSQKNIELDFMKDLFSVSPECKFYLDLVKKSKILKNLACNYQSKTNAIESNQFLKKWSLLEEDIQFSYFTTAITIMEIALKLGYKKIVFCGIDISLRGYFYDLYPDNENFEIPRFEKLYGSSEPYKLPNQIDILELVDVICSQYKNVDVYVSSLKSKLSDKYKLYPWKV